MLHIACLVRSLTQNFITASTVHVRFFTFSAQIRFTQVETTSKSWINWISRSISCMKTKAKCHTWSLWSPEFPWWIFASFSPLRTTTTEISRYVLKQQTKLRAELWADRRRVAFPLFRSFIWIILVICSIMMTMSNYSASQHGFHQGFHDETAALLTFEERILINISLNVQVLILEHLLRSKNFVKNTSRSYSA